MWNLKPLSLSVSLFALVCETIVTKMHSIESRSVIGLKLHCVIGLKLHCVIGLKLHRSQARPCIIQPGTLTVWLTIRPKRNVHRRLFKSPTPAVRHIKAVPVDRWLTYWHQTCHPRAAAGDWRTMTPERQYRLSAVHPQPPLTSTSPPHPHRPPRCMSTARLFVTKIDNSQQKRAY